MKFARDLLLQMGGGGGEGGGREGEELHYMSHHKIYFIPPPPYLYSVATTDPYSVPPEKIYDSPKILRPLPL